MDSGFREYDLLKWVWRVAKRLVCYCHRNVGNSTRKSIDTKEKNVICEILLDHAYVDHLNSKKKILLNEMTKIMMKSCKISLTIKSQDEDNVNSIKIIYNAWQKFRHQQRGSMKCNIEAVIRYIVVDYILSFLKKKNPIVLIIDSTYKTNNYQLSCIIRDYYLKINNLVLFH